MAPRRQFALLLALGCILDCALAAGTGKCKQACSSDLRPLHHYYEELACTPILKDGECCPASYDCSHIETRDKSRCYFKGQALDVRPDLALLDPSTCQAACFCRQTKEAGAVAELTCANVECPSLFNPPPPDGCKRTFSDHKCCSDGLLCPANVTNETARCEWNGKSYVEGEPFYPDEACTTCVCQKGFDGTLDGPWCRQVTCGLELHYASRLAKGCAPVFYKGTCCPIDWRCPSDDDVVVAAATGKKPGEWTEQSMAASGTRLSRQSNLESDRSSPPAEAEAAGSAPCRWGALTLRPGESVRGARGGSPSCPRCRCVVPPHVVCESDSAALVVAAPEQAPAVDMAKGNRKVRRSPQATCANIRCARDCVVQNGLPTCV